MNSSPAKQQETRKGRAELKLAKRSSLWHAKPENRNLPAPWEWFTIRRLTDSARWKPQEQAVMRRAAVQATRGGLLASAIAILAVLGFIVRGKVLLQQERFRVEGLVAQLITAEPAQVPAIVKQLAQASELADPLLAPLVQVEPKTVDEQRSLLHAQLAVVARDASAIDPLVEQLLTSKVSYLEPIRQQLRPYAGELTEKLRSILRDEKAEANRRFHAAIALADYVPESEAASWTKQDLRLWPCNSLRPMPSSSRCCERIGVRFISNC